MRCRRKIKLSKTLSGVRNCTNAVRLNNFYHMHCKNQWRAIFGGYDGSPDAFGGWLASLVWADSVLKNGALERRFSCRKVSIYHSGINAFILVEGIKV